MKKYSYQLILIIGCCFFYISCNKQNTISDLEIVTNNQVLQKIKSYYNNQTLNLSKEFKNVNIKEGEPIWEKTVFDVVQNKYLTPVIVSQKNTKKGFIIHKYIVISINGKGLIGEYIFVIEKKDYQSIILNEKQIQDVLLQRVYYSNITIARKDFGTPATNKVAGNYIVTKIQKEPFKISAKKYNDSIIVSNSYPIESCEDNGGTIVEIEWWFQTYVNGILIFEEYLFSTYECWGAGGGGGGGSSPTPEQLCQIRLAAFENQGVVVSQLISSLTTYEDALSIKVVYNWKIYSALTWGLISYEDAEISKIPTRGGYLNEYSSFTHRSIASVGISIGGTRTFNDLGASINKTQTRAQVRIDFKVTHSPAGCLPGIPILYNANKEFRIFNNVTIE